MSFEKRIVVSSGVGHHVKMDNGPPPPPLPPHSSATGPPPPPLLPPISGVATVNVSGTGPVVQTPGYYKQYPDEPMQLTKHR